MNFGEAILPSVAIGLPLMLHSFSDEAPKAMRLSFGGRGSSDGPDAALPVEE